MNESFIIIGTYRSGTSVIAKIMSCLGIDMGERKDFVDNIEWYPTKSYTDKYSNYISSNPNTYWDLKNKNADFQKIGIRSFEHIKKNVWPKFIAENKNQIGLIWANRDIEKAKEEYSSLMKGPSVVDAIDKQFEICQNIFNNFNSKKTIVSYKDLMQDTKNVAGRISDFCGVLYKEECCLDINPKYLE